MKKKNYPCVAYFEEEIEKEFRKLQDEMYKLTGSKACLNEWNPHITVGKDLELDSIGLLNLTKELNSFAKTQSHFEIELKDFGFMNNKIIAKLYNCEPYVIYIDVIVNKDLLLFVEKLNKILEKYKYKYDIFPYKPHLTLAFKDLNKEGFEKAKEYLKNKKFYKLIKINSFSLATDKENNGQFKEKIKFDFGKLL